MTALALLVADNAAWIASDAAAYTDDGVVRMFVQKVIPCSDWECVITGRGAGRCAELFRQCGELAGVSDFDGLLAHAPDLMRKADDAHLSRSLGAFHHFTIVLCGYSRSRGRFEIHGIRTRTAVGWDDSEGKAANVEAFTLFKMPALVQLPAPPFEVAAALGIAVSGGPIPLEGVRHPEHYVQTSVLACRFTPGHADGNPGGPEHYACGGFIQLTRLHALPNPAPEGAPERAQLVITIDTQITHRWPDRLGERIDPNNGSLPWWVAPPLQLPEDQAKEVAE